MALETGKKCCSLYDWIEEVRDDETTEAMEPMPAEKIAFVVREVAKGLDYLHKQKRYSMFTLFYFLLNSIQNFISYSLKFIYSEKATKFSEISTNYLSSVLPVK